MKSTSNIHIRRLEKTELLRLSEIDRTEQMTQFCKMIDGKLTYTDVDWTFDQWNADEKLKEWTPIAENYKNVWGAFDNDTLIGFAVYRANLTEDMAQFAILHVGNGYRGKGIGKQLANEIINKAKVDGKKRIYLTATPNGATVDFYLKLGFKPTSEINGELFKLEPIDIHMIMEL